jgi:hypothetical protein
MFGEEHYMTVILMTKEMWTIHITFPPHLTRRSEPIRGFCNFVPMFSPPSYFDLLTYGTIYPIGVTDVSEEHITYNL